MAWKINFDGQVYREADLTIGQAERIEKLVGVTWLEIAPLNSASHAKAIVSVMVADRTNAPQSEVADKLSAVTVSDFMAMIDRDTDDLPSEYTDGFPPPAAGTSTAT